MIIMANLYLGLVHYPIYNKNMQVIATAVTNFDIHDISRTARTYEVKKYFCPSAGCHRLKSSKGN